MMVAFAGLQAVLHNVAQTVSAELSNHEPHTPARQDARSMEERMDDSVEEIDIGEYFGMPSRSRVQRIFFSTDLFFVLSSSFSVFFSVF